MEPSKSGSDPQSLRACRRVGATSQSMVDLRICSPGYPEKGVPSKEIRKHAGPTAKRIRSSTGGTSRLPR